LQQILMSILDSVARYTPFGGRGPSWLSSNEFPMQGLRSIRDWRHASTPFGGYRPNADIPQSPIYMQIAKPFLVIQKMTACDKLTTLKLHGMLLTAEVRLRSSDEIEAAYHWDAGHYCDGSRHTQCLR